MLSRLLDWIVPARRKQRREKAAIEGLIEEYLDPAFIEKELKRQEAERCSPQHVSDPAMPSQISLCQEVRRLELQVPPVWTGDLNDDCTAKWAGFLLRAEWMDKDDWWYAVTDRVSGLIVEDSTVLGAVVKDGEIARKRCEDAARRFLGVSEP